jgi:hypothetical protein
MPLPWLRILNAAVGFTELARRVTRRPLSEDRDLTEAARTGGPLEARLAGVVVAALKEAFDRDHQRLELEREQLEAERQRAERVLRLELMRQAADREVGRLRLIAGVAAASWLGTLFFASALTSASLAPRIALGVGWLFLLGALGAAFAAQAAVVRALNGSPADRSSPGDLSSGIGGALAPWLIVAGLAAIALGVLLT